MAQVIGYLLLAAVAILAIWHAYSKGEPPIDPTDPNWRW